MSSRAIVPRAAVRKAFLLILLLLYVVFASGQVVQTQTLAEEEERVVYDEEKEQNRSDEQKQQPEQSLIPPIFVLNLDRHPARWEEVMREMARQGLEVNRLSAVDGRALSKQELAVQSTSLSTFFQPRGVIGCYLSHKKFWQMVVDEGMPHAIVFEDDVALIPNFKETLESNMRRIAADGNKPYDVIMLGAIGRVHPEGKDGIGTRFFSRYIGGKRKLQKINDYLYHPARPAGTHAYMVSFEGAKKLLDLCPKAVFHVDLDAWRHTSLDIQMFYPMLAYQTFESTTLTDVEQKHNRVAKYIMKTSAFQKFCEWAIDPYTLQPWSHVFAEPLLQLGPGGPVLTVERHCIVVGLGCVGAGILELKGHRKYSMAVATGVLGFMGVVRGIIWLLMDWK